MANAIYGVIGTRFTFEPSGGDVTFTLTSLGSGAGRISNTYDRSTGSKPIRYGGSMRITFGDTPVAGEFLRIYLVEQWEHRDGGTPAYKPGGDLGSSDAAVSDENDLIAAGIMIGSLRVPPGATSSTECISLPFDFVTRARKFQIGVWNATSDVLSSTAGDHEVALFPLYDEIQ